jgi:hypothetical protein
MLPTIREDEASVNPANPGEHQTINVGERVEIQVWGSELEEPTEIYVGGDAVVGGSDLNARVAGDEVRVGTAYPGRGIQVFHYTPEQAGELAAYTENTWAVSPQTTVEPGPGSGGIQNDTAFRPDEEERRVNTPDGEAASGFGVIGAIGAGVLVVLAAAAALLAGGDT